MKYLPVLILLLAWSVFGIDVDIYNPFSHGLDNAQVTADSMDASSYGGVDSSADWTSNGDSCLFSDSFPTEITGSVIVEGSDRYSSGKSLKIADKWQSVFVQVAYGNGSGREGSTYDNVSFGCFLSADNIHDSYIYNWHDIVQMSGNVGIINNSVVLQFLKDGSGRRVRLHSYVLKGDESDDSTVVSDSSILVDRNTTYWVSLKYDNSGYGLLYLYSYPELTFIDSVYVPSVPSGKIISRMRFGRTDAHGDNSWENTGYYYFSQIMIDTLGQWPLLPSASSESNIHYVSSTGTGTWEQSLNVGTSCSMGTANDSAAAGDTVYIIAGTYSTGIIPEHSGTVGDSIYYIGDTVGTVKISGAARGIDVTDYSFVSIKNVQIISCAYYMYLDSANNCTFNNIYMDSCSSVGGWPVGIRIRRNSQKLVFRNCEAYRCGRSSGGEDLGGVIDLGISEDVNDHCDSIAFIDCSFGYGGHHVMSLTGKNIVVQRCFFTNPKWMYDSDSVGNRLVIFGYDSTQSNRNIFINNVCNYTFTPTDQTSAVGISIRTKSNIIRNNSFYATDGSAISMVTTIGGAEQNESISDNYIFSNTIFKCGFPADAGADYWQKVGLSIVRYNGAALGQNIHIVNNLFKSMNDSSICFYGGVLAASQDIRDNYLDIGDPLFVDSSEARYESTPPDVYLQTGSACIGLGGFLTRVSTEAGSGASFDVDDAGYFFDGFGITDGDTIKLKSGDVGYVTSVDYATNTITTSNSVSWETDDSISTFFYGTRPDIGAKEFNSDTVSNRILRFWGSR